MYDVPWASEPPRPLGIPLEPARWPWLAAVVAVSAVAAYRRRTGRAPAASPAVVDADRPRRRARPAARVVRRRAAAAAGGFAGDGQPAPHQRARRCAASPTTSQVLPDGPRPGRRRAERDQLTASTGTGRLRGRTRRHPTHRAPAPRPYLWGSRTPDEHGTGNDDERVVRAPARSPPTAVWPCRFRGAPTTATSWSSSCGRADGAGVVALGDRTPDRPARRRRGSRPSAVALDRDRRRRPARPARTGSASARSTPGPTRSAGSPSPDRGCVRSSR